MRECDASGTDLWADQFENDVGQLEKHHLRRPSHGQSVVSSKGRVCKLVGSTVAASTYSTRLTCTPGCRSDAVRLGVRPNACCRHDAVYAGSADRSTTWLTHAAIDSAPGRHRGPKRRRYRHMSETTSSHRQADRCVVDILMVKP
jgi:hypothetical protein